MQLPDFIQNEWKKWGLFQAPELIDKFSYGVNHQCYKLSDGNKPFVLKLFDETQNKSRRQVAIATQRLAATKDLSAKLIYVSDDSNYLLMEFVDHQPLFNTELLANSLHKLHTLKPLTDHTPFDATSYTETYWLEREHNTQNEARLIGLHQSMQPYLHQFDAMEKNVLCHNDLVADNICFTNNNVLFLDWEYAQINTFWFDLASLIVYLNLDKSQTNELLTQYFSSSLNHAELIDSIHSQEKLHTSKAVVLWLDILWHLRQTQVFESKITTQISKKIDQLHSVLTERLI